MLALETGVDRLEINPYSKPARPWNAWTRWNGINVLKIVSEEAMELLNFKTI